MAFDEGLCGGSAVAPNRQAFWKAKIRQIADSIDIQTAILASVETLEGDYGDEIRATKAKIVGLQRELEAAHHNLRLAAPLAQPSSLASSHMSTPGVMSPANMSNNRKRSIGSSHLDIGPFQTEAKSRKTTPSPNLAGIAAASNIDDSGDDVSIIDLTGDDEQLRSALIRKQKEREDQLSRDRMMQEQDQALARQVAAGYSPGPSTPAQNRFGVSSSQLYLGMNAFDRLMNRPSQSRSSAPPMPFSPPRPKQEEQSSGTRAGIPLLPRDLSAWPSSAVDSEPATNGAITSLPSRPRMPGSYTASDQDDDDIAFVSSRPLSMSRNGFGAGSSQSASVFNPLLAGFDFPFSGLQPLGAYGHVGASTPSGYLGGIPRPGTLSNGSYNPFAARYGNGGVGSSRFDNDGLGSTRLGPIINRTNQYEFLDLTDENGDLFSPQLRTYVQDAFNDPRKTDEDLKQLLSNIRPDMEIPVEERGETPEAMRFALYPHQQLALNWMMKMEEGTNKGGILADDMGLGKTVSTLSLMISRKAEDDNKTTLIVGPVALVRQWQTEIKAKLKPLHGLSVFLSHGAKKPYSELKQFDVVLTTYGSLASEFKRFEKHVQGRTATDEKYDLLNDKDLEQNCPFLHPKHKFYRIVLDEAQCIKNPSTQSSRAATMVKSTYRWCLTGTPMMNGIKELYPLLRFLRIRPYNDMKQFNQAFATLTAKSTAPQHVRDRQMKQLRAVLAAVMLRRLKTSKIDGKPILDLPKKEEHAEHVEFSPDEQDWYTQLETKSQTTFSRYQRAGTIGKHYSNILVLLLRLRQACCHPHLDMEFDAPPANGSDVSEEQALEYAKTLSPEVVTRILEALGAFECPICFDATLNPVIFFPCGHDTCPPCLDRLKEKTVQSAVQDGHDAAQAWIVCPECRGPVDTGKLINYSTFKRVYGLPGEEEVQIKPSKVKDEDENNVVNDSDSVSDSDDLDDDVDERGNLRNFIVADNLGKDEGIEPEQSKGKRRKSKKGKKKAEEVKPHELKKLRLESVKNKEARRKYMRYLKDHWEDSAKVTKVMSLLERIQEAGEKTIVFSQWTALLDLIEVQIKQKLGIGYCRYDGGMSAAKRNETANNFSTNPRNTVMLCSLKAGNAGLNLTAASRVIICDPFWNPFTEMQAVDRAHRIGQQRKVYVHRILIRDTIEDRIMSLQEGKRKLVDAALDEGESKNVGRLSHRELAYLFGMPDGH